MSKTSLLVAALCAVVVAAIGASSAFAGESTGNFNRTGKQTPIGAAPDDAPHASSICSFSGQNDVPEGDLVPVDPEDPESPLEIDPLSVGRVQSWGQTLNLAAATFLPPGTKGKSALTGDIHSFGPGVSCRGYASGGGGEP